MELTSMGTDWWSTLLSGLLGSIIGVVGALGAAYLLFRWQNNATHEESDRQREADRKIAEEQRQADRELAEEQREADRALARTERRALAAGSAYETITIFTLRAEAVTTFQDRQKAMQGLAQLVGEWALCVAKMVAAVPDVVLQLEGFSITVLRPPDDLEDAEWLLELRRRADPVRYRLVQLSQYLVAAMTA